MRVASEASKYLVFAVEKRRKAAWSTATGPGRRSLLRRCVEEAPAHHADLLVPVLDDSCKAVVLHQLPGRQQTSVSVSGLSLPFKPVLREGSPTEGTPLVPDVDEVI